MKNQNPLHFATDEEIQKFIKEKKFNELCPVCQDKKQEWLLYGSHEDQYHPYIFRRSNKKNPWDETEWGLIPCYSLMCSNCGYIRTFSKWIVRSWLENKE